MFEQVLKLIHKMSDSSDHTSQNKSRQKLLWGPPMLTIGALAIAASFGIFALIASYPAWFKEYEGFKEFCKHLSTSFLIFGSWSVLEQLLIKKEIQQEMKGFIKIAIEEQEDLYNTQAATIDKELRGIRHSIIPFAESDTGLGLIETHSLADFYDYDTMVKESPNLTVVTADAKSWFGHHLPAWRKRFEAGNNHTTFILIHPESKIIPIMNSKIDSLREGDYKSQIENSINQILKVERVPSAELKVFGHKLIPCHAVFITDAYAVLVPFFMSSMRNSSPAFVFRDAGDDSYFFKLRKDIDQLKKESLEITLPIATTYRARSVRNRRSVYSDKRSSLAAKQLPKASSVGGG